MTRRDPIYLHLLADFVHLIIEYEEGLSEEIWLAYVVDKYKVKKKSKTMQIKILKTAEKVHSEILDVADIIEH